MRLQSKSRKVTEEERDCIVAEAIRARNCPFGQVPDGQGIRGKWSCPLGLPGCGCADEEMLNPFLNVDQRPEAPAPPETE